ncbi:hypothetical protein LXL04_003706 [Taraxacum kok-saghyz]
MGNTRNQEQNTTNRCLCPCFSLHRFLLDINDDLVLVVEGSYHPNFGSYWFLLLPASICTSLLGNKLTEVTETHHLQQPTVFSDQNTPPINVRLYGSAWEIIFPWWYHEPVPSERGERRMDGDNETMKVYKTGHHGDVDDDHVADKYGGYYVEK